MFNDLKFTVDAVLEGLNGTIIGMHHTSAGLEVGLSLESAGHMLHAVTKFALGPLYHHCTAAYGQTGSGKTHTLIVSGERAIACKPAFQGAYAEQFMNQISRSN